LTQKKGVTLSELFMRWQNRRFMEFTYPVIEGMKLGDKIVRKEGLLDREYLVIRIDNGMTAVLVPMITNTEHIRRCNQRVIAEAQLKYIESCRVYRQNLNFPNYK
jgi:hypothetical protein